MDMLIPSWPKKVTKRLSVFVLTALALVSVSASVSAQAACRLVHGQIEATGLTEPCPAQFCSVGLFKGSLNGDYLVATTLNNEQPDPDVLFYTGVTKASVRFGSRQGDLQIKNTGVFRASGELTELETITGGTGELAGASGLLFVAGTSGETSGLFTYEGTICVP